MGHLDRRSETPLNVLVLVVLRACSRKELEVLINLHLLQAGDGHAIGQIHVRRIVILGEHQKNGHWCDSSGRCGPCLNILKACGIIRTDTDQKSVSANECFITRLDQLFYRIRRARLSVHIDYIQVDQLTFNSLLLPLQLVYPDILRSKVRVY